MKLYDFHSTPFDFQAGAFLKFATSAALADYDDRLVENGGVVFVESYRDYFQKVVESPAPAAASGTIVPTSTGDGGWYRLGIASPTWASQAAWYIDPAAGDDENDGNTTGTALETWAEFCRRASVMAVSMTVTIVSNITERLVGGFESSVTTDISLLITGTPTVVAYSALSPAATVTYVDPNPAGNTRGTITCSNLLDSAGVTIATGFDTFSNYFVRVTGESVAPILTYAAGVAQVPFFFDKLLNATKPVNNTALEVLQLTTAPCMQVVTRGVITHAQYLKFTSTATNDQTFIDWHGQIGTISGNSGTFFACEFGGSLSALMGDFILSCLFTGSGAIRVDGGAVAISGGGHKRNLLHAKTGLIMFDGHIFQGARLSVGISADFTSGARVEVYYIRGLGVFDCTGGSAIALVGDASLGARILYGTNPGNGAYGLEVSQGAQVQIHPSGTPTITGQTNAIFFNSAGTAIPPLTATAVVPAASALATWTNWTDPPFSRNVVSYTNGSKICGT